MPRKKLKPEHAVEYLSILNKQGKTDDKLVPEIDDDTLARMHRTMLLSRRFDERMLTLQRQGRIGTFAPARGQEASQIGAMAALRKDDWFVPAFREFAAMLWRGFPLTDILLINAGYSEGGAIPEDSTDLPIAIPVASQVPHAVGLAYASRYRASDAVSITFFGDGATSEGDFHEALNLASALKTPTIFLCQNNQWAISMPRERQSASRTLAQKGLAYAVPSLQVDGNDVFAVYAAVSEAAERARAGDGPTLIECLTFRMGVHTTADDPSKYRDEQQVEKWRDYDPLPRFQTYLKGKGVLEDDAIESLENELQEQLDNAWDETDKRMRELTDPAVMFDHVYAETPDYLQAQRQMFEQQFKGGE